MTLLELDRARLTGALALAELAIGLSDPNPRVGCVIGDQNGAVFGRGHTQQAGGAHAEIMALRDAAAAGRSLQGATAWVTLEPCAHQGRTPPCCDALLEAGIARVVVAIGDPYHQVDGAGIEQLRAAGVVVDMADTDIADAARELNIGFFSRVKRGRPWVRLKIATSLDGRTALDNGDSQWITGPEARADGHAWRKRAGAIVTGIGTVQHDDPRLDVRLVPTVFQPLRVVVDSRLQTPPAARLLDPPGKVLIGCVQADSGRADTLRARGAEVVLLPGEGARVELAGLVHELGRRAINEVHVEAGPLLNGALLALGLVDELLLYQAPLLIGPGRGLAALEPLAALSAALRFDLIEVARCGADLRLRLRSALSGSFTSPDHATRGVWR